MDNFTLAVLIGGVLVFISFGVLLVLDSKSKSVPKRGPVKTPGKRTA